MTCSTCGGEIIADVCMKCSAVHRADVGAHFRNSFPVISGVWRHYKGHHYLVIGEIRHTETNEVCVAYIPLYEHESGGIPLQARPKTMWNEDVLHEGQTVRRFVYVGSEVPKK